MIIDALFPIDDAAPPIDDAAPPIDDAAPPIDDAAPPIDDAAPPIDDAAPPIDDAAPPIDDAAPPIDDAAPPIDDAALPIDDAAPPEEGNPIELLADRHFSRGFHVKDPVSGDVTGVITPGFAQGAPLWQIGQWGSATNIGDSASTTLASGAVRWEDAYGAVTVGPPGSEEADLSLYVNAYEEYGGVYRARDAAVTWPHLLGEQRISPPGNAGPGCPPLSTLSSLRFSVDARLHFDHRNIGVGYDPSRHAGHYLMYFTVQNLAVPNTPGYGDYLWFGLTLYDDRDEMPGLAVSGDDATGKLIYNIGLAPLSNASLNDNAWHTLEEDLLPHVLRALDAAWARGYLPHSQDPTDYRIGGMNLGWEIPGLNAAELQIRDISLTYTAQSAPNPGGELRYDFNVDGEREGWSAGNMDDPNHGPVEGRWILSVPGQDPMLTSPALQLEAADYSSLSVTMANDHNPAEGSRMQIFWSVASDPGFSEGRSAWINIGNGGGWATYTFDLTALPAWSGVINRVRVDPIMYGDGHSVGFDSIVFTPL
ncbi:hypothetical protein KKB55_01110 [Myxococcota bacterium]|nr:hypothetical protein [Myxococcota bacterium]